MMGFAGHGSVERAPQKTNLRGERLGVLVGETLEAFLRHVTSQSDMKYEWTKTP